MTAKLVSAAHSAALTQQQARALAFIREYEAANGWCPSYAEIAEHIGVSGKSTVHRIISELQERGFVRHTPKKKRSIEIVVPRTIQIESEIFAVLKDFADKNSTNPAAATNEILRHFLMA